jgi:hypothetical protein
MLGKLYEGPFLPRDGKASGHLVVKGKKASLKTIRRERDHSIGFKAGDCHGVLVGGKKASLLDCIAEESTTHIMEGNESWQKVRYLPSKLILGNRFFSSSDQTIRSIQFSFDNAENLAARTNAIGSESPDPNKLKALLEACEADRIESMKEHGYDFSPGPEIDVGEHPEIAYVSGQREIIRAPFLHGQLVLWHRASGLSASEAGIQMKNQVACTIEFDSEVGLDFALRQLHAAFLFFELILGREQRLRFIEISTNDAESDVSEWSQLVWCNFDRKNRKKPATTHVIDILLDPVARPDEFIEVLSGWMNSHPEMAESRNRFSQGFRMENRLTVDRMIGAANMFDLLPASKSPKDKHIPKCIQTLAGTFKAALKKVPKSDARESYLRALGFAKKISLREKINHRCVAIKALDPRFHDIDFVNKHAVNCRNRYVHGTVGDFDYQKYVSAYASLIYSLEFSFAVSDLVDLGWDYRTWAGQGTTQSHPFGMFVVNYENSLAELRSALDTTRG